MINPAIDRQLRLMSNPVTANREAPISSVRADLNQGFSNTRAFDRRARTMALMAELLDALNTDDATETTTVEYPRYVFGDKMIDPHMREVTRNGTQITLSPREYELLLALAMGNGAPVSRQTLASVVWHEELSDASRTIDQHIGQLRKKIEDKQSKPSHIRTVTKFGYRLVGSWLTRDGKTGSTE